MTSQCPDCKRRRSGKVLCSTVWIGVTRSCITSTLVEAAEVGSQGLAVYRTRETFTEVEGRRVVAARALLECAASELDSLCVRRTVLDCVYLHDRPDQLPLDLAKCLDDVRCVAFQKQLGMGRCTHGSELFSCNLAHS